jgi:hypothetical protein
MPGQRRRRSSQDTDTPDDADDLPAPQAQLLRTRAAAQSRQLLLQLHENAELSWWAMWSEFPTAGTRLNDSVLVLHHSNSSGRLCVCIDRSMLLQYKSKFV